MSRAPSHNARPSSRWLLVLPLLLLGAGGCAAPTDGVVGMRPQAVPIGAPCDDNSQCDNFDDDTRLIICNVPTGMMTGVCFDCVPAAPRPVGCFCSTSMDCAAGLWCNGRTCQAKRARGEFCVHDDDCAASDGMGALYCLPTKSYCGPAPNGYFCDFQTDCLSGRCNAMGICSLGGVDDDCAADSDCTAPAVCSFVTFRCVNPQADGAPCTRNAECQNQCNSFSGLCTLGVEGTLCTLNNPDGDCQMGLTCVECVPGQGCTGAAGCSCRTPGSECL